MAGAQRSNVDRSGDGRLDAETPEAEMPAGDRPRRSDATRNYAAILTRATAVLAADPQASMAEIARATGIGRTTLYRHFPDRQALVDAIYESVLAQADSISAARLLDQGHAIDVVAGLCDALAGLGDRYRFLEHHQTDILTQDPAEARRRGAPLHRYLAGAQRTGEVRPDLDVDWLFSVLVRLITQASIHRFASASERSRTLRATVDALLRPVA